MHPFVRDMLGAAQVTLVKAAKASVDSVAVDVEEAADHAYRAVRGVCERISQAPLPPRAPRGPGRDRR